MTEMNSPGKIVLHDVNQNTDATRDEHDRGVQLELHGRDPLDGSVNLNREFSLDEGPSISFPYQKENWGITTKSNKDYNGTSGDKKIVRGSKSIPMR